MKLNILLMHDCSIVVEIINKLSAETDISSFCKLEKVLNGGDIRGNYYIISFYDISMIGIWYGVFLFSSIY